MPQRYTSLSNDDNLRTYEQVINTIKHSSNKNDAVRSLSDITISGSECRIGRDYASRMYDTYREYNTSARIGRR